MRPYPMKGFTLVEIMISLGLLSGISLVTIKMMENHANNQTVLKAKAEIQKTTLLIKAALQDPENCRYMFRDQTIGSYQSPVDIGSPLPIDPMDPELPPGLYQRYRNHANQTWELKELITPNSDYNGFRVGLIQLRYPKSGLQTMAELVVNFKVEIKNFIFNDKKDGNEKIYPRVIPLTVKQIDDKITDCSPAVSDTNLVARKKFCLSLGGMAEWVNGKCQFKEISCSPGQVPRKVAQTGQLTCVPASDQFKASDLFDTTSCTVSGSRSFSVEKVGTKLKIVCH
jgi:prepilin-type N-terminal cleavage/methylation domain-containing protein